MSFKSRNIIINIDDYEDYKIEILLSSVDLNSIIRLKINYDDELEVKFDDCDIHRNINHDKRRQNVTLSIGIKSDNVWNFDFNLDGFHHSIKFTCRVFNNIDEINSISFNKKYPTWIRYSSKTEGK